MINIVHFLEALDFIFELNTILLLLAGTSIGIFIGAVPGLGPAVGIALSIPFSLSFPPLIAIPFLVTIYVGAMFGGSIASILINAPGTGASAATTLEGYPMAKKGQAITALSISATSSSIGGLIGPIFIIFFISYLGRFILLFGTPEFFLMGVLGITLIAVVSKQSLLKGLISGAFGLLLTTIGMAPMVADVRFSFGSLALFDGIGFMPAIIGLFAVAEMMKLAEAKSGGISELVELTGSRIEGIKETLKNYITLIKSSLIGIIVGAIPGAGATTATFIAYSEAMRSSKRSAEFGTGVPEGIVATESSNNAVVGGALLPTLIFGIPGSASTAVLMGGLLLHGLRPGLGLFRGAGLSLTYAIFLSIIVSQILIFVIGLTMSVYLGKITVIPKEILIPLVLIVSSLGIYALELNFIQLWIVAFFGLFGYFMVKYGYPLIPAILAIILGSMIEENFQRTITIGGGSLSILLKRPISLLLIIAIVLILVGPLISGLVKKIKKERNDD